MERLQKVIANYGYASRREAEKLIASGQVKVNDVVVRELGTKVSSSDIIQINNVQIDKNIGYEYYLLYKPRGVISSVSDNKGRKTVKKNLILFQNRVVDSFLLLINVATHVLIYRAGRFSKKKMILRGKRVECSVDKLTS